jgi:hypothetical protein
MSHSMTLVYLAVALISSYVLWFSSIPFLYRIAIVAFSFVLLILISLALTAVESIGKRPYR